MSCLTVSTTLIFFEAASLPNPPILGIFYALLQVGYAAPSSGGKKVLQDTTLEKSKRLDLRANMKYITCNIL
jgi:hypothetical protein